MWTEEIHRAAKEGEKNKVARLVDEEGVEVNSKDRVSVCCALVAHLGAVWDSTDTLLSFTLLRKVTWTSYTCC